MNKKSKQNLIIIIAIILSAVIIFFAINSTGKSSINNDDSLIQENANNVSVVDGKQIVEIKAKGGYSPTHSIAQAGLPTILRVNTNGTFDCSSSIRIPSLNISKNLPMSGTTDIDIGTQQIGLFQGTCGMGMYPFDIKFQ